MSQTSIVMQNTSRTQYRARHNDVNAALASNFSGSTAPSNPAPGWTWFNTTNGKMMVRNALNTAWDEMARPVLNENDFASNSATQAPSQRSTAEYVAAQIAAFAGGQDGGGIALNALEDLEIGSFRAFGPVSQSFSGGAGWTIAVGFIQSGNVRLSFTADARGPTFVELGGQAVANYSSGLQDVSLDLTIQRGDQLAVTFNASPVLTTLVTTFSDLSLFTNGQRIWPVTDGISRWNF